MQNPRIVISGTGLFTPAESISNDELVVAFNSYVDQYNSHHQSEIEAGDIAPLAYSSSEFIEKASGIKNRYVMNKSGVLDPKRMCPTLTEREDTALSIQAEMAVSAAKQAMAAANKTAAEIDTVIVACSNLQRAYPAIAIEVQQALGIDGFAYDMNIACSSATFALQAAYNAVFSGSSRCVLMVNPEICSGHLEWRDRDCHFIFGDAATAVIIEPAEQAYSEQQFYLLGTKLKTQFSNNIRNNFGFLNRADKSGIHQRDKLFCQNGRKVFKEVCPMVARMIGEHLQQLDIQPGKLKRMWLHQANLSMNELIARKVLGRDPEPAEAPVILDSYANTSSAGSIIAFHLHNADLDSGDKGVICSFGAGYSVGSIVVEKR
ncbi:MAG: beta-ketoacyl-ACP synthase III [Amphritea sp.]